MTNKICPICGGSVVHIVRHVVDSGPVYCTIECRTCGHVFTKKIEIGLDAEYKGEKTNV